MQQNPYPDQPLDRQVVDDVPPNPAAAPTPAQYAANRRNEVNRAVNNQDRVNTTAYAVGKFLDFLGWVLLVIEVILLVRFLLKLIGADPANPFASFLYGLSGIFSYMFQGIVRNPTFGSNGFEVFEFTTLIAMLIYGLVYLILKLLLRTTFSRPSEPVV